jgi:predicted transcriptional regulator YdeE
MIEIFECVKSSFSVIGKVGVGNALNAIAWIGGLWKSTNENYLEIEELSKKDDHGRTLGFWGAMSDTKHTYAPWNDLGMYLAGVEVEDDRDAPQGWTKWTIPGYKYLYAKVTGDYDAVMDEVIHRYMPDKGYHLAGAIHEYYCPEENGQLYLFFPIERI